MKTRGCVTGLCLVLAALFAESGEPSLSLFQVALSAGKLPRTPSLDRVDRWLTAIEQHVPGRDDEAFRAATSWNRDDLYEILFHVGALVALARDPGAIVTFRRMPGSNGPIAVYGARDVKRIQELGHRARDLGERSLLTRGALLHTDAALLGEAEESGSNRRANTWSAQVFVRTSDGRQLGSHEIAGHLEAARAMLGLLKAKPKANEAVRLWYRATAAYLQREVQLDQVHIDAALALFPKDPELLLLAGALHETFASARIQLVATSANLPFGVSLGIGSTGAELHLAEHFFRKTLGVDAQHTEAHVRLGNVLGQLGRHKDASSELQQALGTVGADPVLAYYARMFLAREAEQLGAIAQARASYEKAAQLYPRAQSVFVALSQLAGREGDMPRARQALLRGLALAEAPDNAEDPWWQYSTFAGRTADALLADARAALIRDGER